mmetsp:Transcript_26307/g.66338  ORF Transcript_26307/g.66338 Transcript_26307/m.66338 type:complete len:400 (-) Transcript_26307:1926-3125(-)
MLVTCCVSDSVSSSLAWKSIAQTSLAPSTAGTTFGFVYTVTQLPDSRRSTAFSLASADVASRSERHQRSLVAQFAGSSDSSKATDPEASVRGAVYSWSFTPEAVERDNVPETVSFVSCCTQVSVSPVIVVNRFGKHLSCAADPTLKHSSLAFGHTTPRQSSCGRVGAGTVTPVCGANKVLALFKAVSHCVCTGRRENAALESCVVANGSTRLLNPTFWMESAVTITEFRLSELTSNPRRSSEEPEDDHPSTWPCSDDRRRELVPPTVNSPVLLLKSPTADCSTHNEYTPATPTHLLVFAVKSRSKYSTPWRVSVARTAVLFTFPAASSFSSNSSKLPVTFTAESCRSSSATESAEDRSSSSLRPSSSTLNRRPPSSAAVSSPNCIITRQSASITHVPIT